MMRWPAILFWSLRLAYLQAVHRRVLQVAPAHAEASRTWFEIQRARQAFDASWGQP